jgi:HK97 family phage major capsid protein
MKNSIELKEERSLLNTEYKQIIETAKTENRSLSEDEIKNLDEKKQRIEEINEELRKQKETLENYEKAVLVKEEEKRQNKNIDNKMEKKNFSIVSEIRNAMSNGTNKFEINAEKTIEKRTAQVTGEAGVHDEVIETEIQGILEPLYAKSVLAQLGVKWYSGLPQGDIQIPIMGKGNVGWAGEIEAASASGNTFTTKKLTPKRLTAYVDISKQLIAQDTIGVENAIRRDIVNALGDKLEATILGYENKTDDKPAGLFYSGILNAASSVSTFAGLCTAEATVEDANVFGEMKYLVNPKGKAILRAMAKSSKNTQLVLEGGTVDGVAVVSTSNVKDQASTNAKAIYGDFSNIAIGSWGNIEVTVDPYTQSTKGCIRLVINAYFDAVVLRKEAFAVMTLSAA